jgi:hypothetical protein
MPEPLVVALQRHRGRLSKQPEEELVFQSLVKAGENLPMLTQHIQ